LKRISGDRDKTRDTVDSMQHQINELKDINAHLILDQEELVKLKEKVSEEKESLAERHKSLHDDLNIRSREIDGKTKTVYLRETGNDVYREKK
jgi:FtsZ-binding cell division protein ZapB